MLAFIGLAHQAGAYTPQTATPLFESMMQASLTTHGSLSQISRAASYALPALHASGANSSDVMLMLATMMQAGILNTKSGTWLNNMGMNALPNSLGSGLFSNKRQNEALQMLGLYKGNQAQFYKNGQFDLMQEVAILAAARERMDPLKFNAATRQAFGVQGQRAAALFSEPQVLANLHMLASMTSQAQSPFNVAQAVQTFSTVAKADQTIANANMTLMNATSTFMGPANGALSGLSSLFGWTAKVTKDHPIAGGAMDVGLGIGAAGLLGAAWKGGALGVDLIGKKLITPILGGLWKVALRAVSGLGAGVLEVALTSAGTLANAGAATSALGAAIAGAVGYGIGTLINHGMNWAIESITHGKESNLGGWVYDVTHPNAAGTSAAPHVTVQIDGEDVRHHIVNGMQVAPNRAATGVNPLRAPMNPSLGWAPGL